MVYQWRSGTRITGISAQVAGEVCAQLAATGDLNAQRLVDVSRKDGAPLHAAFEWDDAVAGEEWRKHQARNIINAIVVAKDEHTPVQVRAFFKVENVGSNYEPVQVIMRSPTKRELLLQDAMRELGVFRKKYATLSELSAVFEAIDSTQMKFAM